MARSNKPDVGATIARLEKQILAVASEVQTLEAERRRCLIVMAQEPENTSMEAEAQRHAADIREKRDHLQALRGALEDAKDAKTALTADAATAQARRERDALKALARDTRQAAEHLDTVVTAVGPALLALREATKALWEAADGPTRREELGELPRLLSDLPMVIHERLAHGGVLASRSVAFDTTAKTPSTAAHLDIALDQIAPGPGRPRGQGTEPEGIAA